MMYITTTSNTHMHKHKKYLLNKTYKIFNKFIKTNNLYYHCQGNGKPNLIGYYLNLVRTVLSNETEASEDKDKKGTTRDCFF